MVGELLKQASWRDDIRALDHWRTHDGDEVDLVAETLDGTVVGFEIKAGLEVDTKSLRGLVALRDSLGDQFRSGARKAARSAAVGNRPCSERSINGQLREVGDRLPTSAGSSAL